MPKKMAATLWDKSTGGVFRYSDRDDSCLGGSEKGHSKLETLVLTLEDEEGIFQESKEEEGISNACKAEKPGWE